MTTEREALAALLHIETVGCNHVSPAACDPRPGSGGKDDRHMAQADHLIDAGVRVALTAFACEPCWDFIAAHHASLDAPHASPERP